MPMAADVLVAGTLSTGEAAALGRDFARVGLTAEVREVPPRRSVGDFAWLILAALPLKPFFEQLAKDSAGDAYRGLKSLAATVLRRGRPSAAAEPSEVLLLQDRTTGVAVVLEPDLPDRAYEQLLTFDLASIRRGPLHYDRHRGEWRSELDEADRRVSSASP